MGSEPNGTLLDWRSIAGEHKWDTLLLGNGMSINVWEPFKYRALYDHAKSEDLSNADRKLFEATPNFERVLADLLTAIRVNEAIGIPTVPALERYQNIQRALVHAVQAVHVNRERVPLSTRRKIRSAMLKFEWVFTTSYDLLLYWSMGCEGFTPFMDHFRYGGRCAFDPARAVVPPSAIPVYFLHGALHLVVGGSGTTWKLTQRNLDTLLDQFGKPIAGDPKARPLLVTEGSAADKLSAIEDNDYLSHALERLYQRDLPVVVFGSGLSQHDAHLAEALSENPNRAVAVSMLPGSKEDLLAKQVDIYGRLKAKPLLFFNAKTHPLGDVSLTVPLT
ncbi:MAG TPA: DUF4917 family protein [Solirubrobacterales bacterium]|jgi:hypothetical protein